MTLDVSALFKNTILQRTKHVLRPKYLHHCPQPVRRSNSQAPQLMPPNSIPRTQAVMMRTSQHPAQGPENENPTQLLMRSPSKGFHQQCHPLPHHNQARHSKEETTQTIPKML
nr:gene 4 small orf - Marburg virus [Orthomarburgvirus marburgense]